MMIKDKCVEFYGLKGFIVIVSLVKTEIKPKLL